MLQMEKFVYLLARSLIHTPTSKFQVPIHLPSYLSVYLPKTELAEEGGWRKPKDERNGYQGLAFFTSLIINWLNQPSAIP